MEEKKRSDISNSLGLKDPESYILTEPEPIEIASGYSISIKYDKTGRPLIFVKKYGDLDPRGLRRQIERNYPGAAIKGLEKRKPIKIGRNAVRSRKLINKGSKRHKRARKT